MRGGGRLPRGPLHSHMLSHSLTCSYIHTHCHDAVTLSHSITLALAHTLSSLLISCFLMVAASRTRMQKSQEEKTLVLRGAL